MADVITPIENTNNIRMADFVRITTRAPVNATAMVNGTEYTIRTIGTTDFTLYGADSNTVGEVFTAVITTPATGTGTVYQAVYYRSATTPNVLTIPAVDSQPFDALGSLIKIGDVQRDIKSTANETTITLVGLDTAFLGWVLGHDIKGSMIEMWHGFFNTNNELITTGGTGGLYKFFTGYISSFQISEEYMEEERAYVGVITASASSIQIILQNRTAGRFTNNNAWNFFNPGDTSMNRVNFIETINYSFGKDV
jgi:hypothetical protein